MSNKNLCSCLVCKTQTTTNNLNKHYLSKTCVTITINTNLKVVDGKCPYCNIFINHLKPQQRANHCRWCVENPKHGVYKEAASVRLKNNKRPSSIKLDYEEIGKKISQRHKEGAYLNSPRKRYDTKVRNGTLKPSDDTKKKMSVSAGNSKHQRVCKRTHTYIDIKGRSFKFDSSWEDALADRLDELDIAWDRPPPIQYSLNGKNKNYFPDFYLPDHDLYIDPKNPYCEEQQKVKLDIVSKMIKLKILRSKEDCENFNI